MKIKISRKRHPMVSANIPCLHEPVGLSRNNGTRPDGLSPVPWHRGCCLPWDGTCVSTFSPLHPGLMSHALGAADAAQTKRPKCSNLLPGFKEYEAEVEEERLRKEREARERQDVMTLEETKEQIEQLEQKLKQLEKEKQQLFMQLKKVLNEDEIRKRQQQKETNEMQPMKMQMSIQVPMFPLPAAGQGEPPPAQGRPPPLSSHLLNKTKHSNYMLSPQQQTIVRGPVQAGGKRPRSPSPTYALYAHRLHQPPMKHQQVYSDHKVEDGRMGRQMARAVLWNKSSQYGPSVSSSSPAYYAMPTSSVVGVVGERPPPLLYAHHAHTPHTPHTPHHANLMYAPAPQPQQLYIDMLKTRDGQHQDNKKEGQQPSQMVMGLPESHHSAAVSSAGVYAPPVSRHPALHHSNIQTAKPSSITQGYPVQQSNPNVQNPNIYPNRHRY